jgi:sialic acid synthase SpsE
MLSIKRPGTGIQPKYINKVLGKIAKKDIEEDEVLNWNDLE